MNKDDIFKTYTEGINLVVYLAWDSEKLAICPASAREGIGRLWQQYGDEIIAHIQADMKDKPHVCSKCGDTEYFVCRNHSHTAYICTDCAAMTALEAL
jgi:ribosomal protein L37AE/L43A